MALPIYVAELIPTVLRCVYRFMVYTDIRIEGQSDRRADGKIDGWTYLPGEIQWRAG